MAIYPLDKVIRSLNNQNLVFSTVQFLTISLNPSVFHEPNQAV